MIEKTFSSSWLQWGHDREVVEMWGFTGQSITGLGLQWGHDREVVEISLGRLPTLTNSALQWGHDREVVEMGKHSHNGKGRLFASMGPRP